MALQSDYPLSKSRELYKSSLAEEHLNVVDELNEDELCKYENLFYGMVEDIAGDTDILKKETDVEKGKIVYEWLSHKIDTETDNGWSLKTMLDDYNRSAELSGDCCPSTALYVYLMEAFEVDTKINVFDNMLESGDDHVSSRLVPSETVVEMTYPSNGFDVDKKFYELSLLRMIDEPRDRKVIINYALSNKGVYLAEGGEYEKGLECCDKALERDEKHLDAWLSKAGILYKRVTERVGDSGIVLSDMESVEKDMKEAEQYLQRVLEIKPNESHAVKKLELAKKVNEYLKKCFW
ncbi:MAG: hypothetical protein KAU95_02595 [Candidatus Aenigmarchaeota archaeon]|nr:hypothetical protein [Candidatus Aenigmarchaeota archaeon]